MLCSQVLISLFGLDLRDAQLPTLDKKGGKSHKKKKKKKSVLAEVQNTFKEADAGVNQILIFQNRLSWWRFLSNHSIGTFLHVDRDWAVDAADTLYRCAVADAKAAQERKSLVLEALFEIMFRVLKNAAGPATVPTNGSADGKCRVGIVDTLPCVVPSGSAVINLQPN